MAAGYCYHRIVLISFYQAIISVASFPPTSLATASCCGWVGRPSYLFEAGLIILVLPRGLVYAALNIFHSLPLKFIKLDE